MSILRTLRRPAWRAVRPAIIALIVLGAGIAVAADTRRPRAAAQHKPFLVAGAVTGLTPGAPTMLDLTITNQRRHRSIMVTAVSATVGDAGPGCGAGNLSVGSFAGQLKMHRLASKHVSIPVLLAPAAPDACQGATFPLTFTGTAVDGQARP